MQSHQENCLLALLPVDTLTVLKKYLSLVDLKPDQVLANPGDEIRRVYFPHSGIVSFMVEVADGHVVQTGMVGRDGVIGAAQAVDGKVSVNKIVVQMPGTAAVIDRDPLLEAIKTSAVRNVLAAHAQFFLADIQQTAACNALHAVEARMARWMLRMMDLVGTELSLTQDYLAAMIGVRRSSVSDVASHLQETGLIRYTRGHIRILNVEGLRRSSCECYEAVRQNYVTLIGVPPPQSN